MMRGKMKKQFLIYSLLLLIFSVNSAFSQVTEDDEPVKVTTSLVQFDAIVTDKNGNPVTNLTINDFELYQDKKLQTITNLTYGNRAGKRQLSEQT